MAAGEAFMAWDQESSPGNQDNVMPWTEENRDELLHYEQQSRDREHALDAGCHLYGRQKEVRKRECPYNAEHIPEDVIGH